MLRKLILVSFFVLAQVAYSKVQLPPVVSAHEGKIWSNVPFIQAGNFHEFEAELSLTRTQARQQLLNEFGSLHIPLAMTTSDITGLAMVLAQIIQDFDSLVRIHADQAHRNIDLSLSKLLLAEYDELFEKHRIPEYRQRGRFYTAEIEPQNMAKNLRFIAYGSYTVVSGGQVKATLTLEELFSGKTRSFVVTGKIQKAAKLLAQKLFDFFHSNRYPEWINPQPHLEWIAPPAPEQAMLAIVARRFCRGQNARLPFAEELIQASLGGDYRQGGIKLERNRYYVVADRQRHVDQYYYNTYPWGNTQTGGPVHTDAGLGRVQAYVWCVRGLPSTNVRLVQSIYRLIRMHSHHKNILGALEFLLVHLQDFGMRDWAASDFQSLKHAQDFLATQGLMVEVPMY